MAEERARAVGDKNKKVRTLTAVTSVIIGVPVERGEIFIGIMHGLLWWAGDGQTGGSGSGSGGGRAARSGQEQDLNSLASCAAAAAA